MSPAKQILDLAEKYKDHTAKNLSRLVRIKSTSCNEREVIVELEQQMREAGFDEVKIDALGNVLGRIGTGKRILAIDAHMDTVDVGNPDNWSFDPFCGDIKDGFVYGRGTVDQEGGAAAFVTSGRILKELGFDRDLSVFFTGTVMEEDCDGLCWKHIIEEDGLKPDFAISTEPTDLNVYRGQRGRMEMEVTFKGLSSHGSAPERGKNAIYAASKVCREIDRLNQNLTGDAFLGKGSITVTDIKSSGPSLCAVPDFAKIHLDRRLARNETKEIAVSQIQEIIQGMDAEVRVLNYLEKSWTGLEYGMEKYYPTWVTPEDHVTVQAGVKVCEELFQKTPKVDKWTFSTNGVVICGLHKIPTIGFGPGNEIYAHAPDEKVPIDDLVKAAAFYALYAYTI